MLSETVLRVLVAVGGMVVGAVFVAILGMTLPVFYADILLDWTSERYPWTIQNLMWLLFFGGLGDVGVRFWRGGTELRQVRLNLLPEDEETMLRAQDLGDIYMRVRPSPLTETGFLQRLIARIVLNFQSSRSVSQANTLLNSSLDLFQHEVDLKYSMMRYLVWLIPTLGFIGTVVGIALALDEAGSMPDLSQAGEIQMEAPEVCPEPGTDDERSLQCWMRDLTGKLALAFNTTMVALLLSAVLVFLMHIAQGREETALNRAGQYCLDNLINRLYEK